MPRKTKKRTRKGTRKGAGKGRDVNRAGRRAFYQTDRSSFAGGPKLSPGRVLGGFPEKMRTTLRYTTNIVLTCTTGAVSFYAFRGNGPYDPDSTSTGGQPVNYDDLSVHYDFYRVYSSRLSIIACNGSNSSTPAQLALVATDGHVPTASVLQYAAQPFALLGVISNTATPLTLASSMTTARIFGQSTVQVMASDNLASAVSTVPVQQWTWIMAFQSMDQSSTVVAQTVITVDYDVEFYGREPADLDTLISRANDLKAARVQFLADRIPFDGKRTFSGERHSDIKQLGDSKGERWSDIDESDEATFAEFTAWKRRTGPQPSQERTAGGLLGPEIHLGAPTSTVAGTSGGSVASLSVKTLNTPAKQRAGIG